jgi:hypothetical protein
MNIYKIKLQIYFQENLFKIYVHLKKSCHTLLFIYTNKNFM